MTDADTPFEMHRQLVTVQSVQVIGPSTLRLEFSDGARGSLDILSFARGPVFDALKDAEFFGRVELDEEIGTVIWPNGADLDPDVLRDIVSLEATKLDAISANTPQAVLELYGKIRSSQLHYGDNLPVMQERIPDESVDLVYLDPPFNSKRIYNVMYKSPDGLVPPDSKMAFQDFWIWDQRTESEYRDLTSGKSDLANPLKALRMLLGTGDLMAYLTMMAPRLLEIRRVLKTTGSVYLHCDQTASHYLKALLDAIFGARNFLNNVVWLYGLGGSSNRYWPRKHDDLLWYSKVPGKQFFAADRVPATSNRLKGKLKKAPDFWDIPALNNLAKERLGYPTQKPLALLERVVRSSSPKDGIVLDPFCGCGTTIEAAQSLGRTWIGIDVSYVAIDVVQKRLENRFGSNVVNDYRMFGKPESMREAEELYLQRRLEFENWAVTLVSAEPQAGKEDVVDGVIRFPMPADEKDGIAVVQVGGEKAGPKMDKLRSTLDRGDADLGLIIPLRPSPSLRQAVRDFGDWTWPVNGSKFQRVQTVSVEELLQGLRPHLPPPLVPYYSQTG